MSVLELADNRVALVGAAERLGVTLETVRLWATRGCRIGQKIIKLRSFRIGTRLFTTVRDLELFLSELNG